MTGRRFTRRPRGTPPGNATPPPPASRGRPAAPPGQDAYLTQVLPAKMRLNLRDVQNFSIGRDLSIALRTVLAVAR